jgi:hypothetical protein
VNAALYYEDEKFSARVSVAYRDEYPTTCHADTLFREPPGQSDQDE